MDIYVEYIFDKPASLRRLLLKDLLIGIGVIFFVYSMFVPIFVPVVFVYAVFVYYFNRSMKREYEFILLNQELSIDYVIAKSSRRHLYTVDLHDLIAYTRTDAKVKYKTRQFVSYSCKDPVYTLLLKHNNRYECIKINANDKLWRGIMQTHPQLIETTMEDFNV